MERSTKKGDIRKKGSIGHPSSPYGLRRDKEGIRLRPTGYAATRRASVFALRATPRQGGQEAVTLSVISYSLFGKSVAMKCPDDLNDFYGFYDLPFTAYRSPLSVATTVFI